MKGKITHELPFDVTPLHAWMSEKTVDYASHFGSGYHAKLSVAVGNQEFIVLDHNEVVYRGTQAIAAIEAYNNIKPR